MATLTNEQIHKLTNEQQETFAAVELRLAQKTERLLEQARPYRGYMFVPSALALSAFCFLAFGLDHRALLTVCVMAFFALIQFHAIGTNRRLNALLELFGTDTKSKAPERQLTDDPVA